MGGGTHNTFKVYLVMKQLHNLYKNVQSYATFCSGKVSMNYIFVGVGGVPFTF